MRPKIYVGRAKQGLEVFKTTVEPTWKAFPQYLFVIGPFRTMRGARFYRDSSLGNPHVLTVADAERIAKKAREDREGFYL